ncbi:MAG: 2Fe-2S iron-sulfur cluster-binding protein, partial [Candidatus Omnitrophota bacterium]|nr:2Fe-2S iron-sulfur cluster-binding protein [Candidatus Omnitrophota bacterium]
LSLSKDPMPKLTIDGKEIEVPAGTPVIQAAEKLGIFVPRYCYHPGLSIAGNCRICLVEIEKAPKLQIACNTPVAEGMVVRTNSQKVVEGQQSVLEFLLINHPLDCPVCDQSGECDLQNFYMQYGRYDARFEEQKQKKPKAVPLGPTIMLDAERCILCSRCVRFTDEISKTGEFGIFNRGDRAVVGLYPGKVLDNNYSGNVADICPVGALTDRDFRFKARVWYLSSAPSVCNGCSQGCNVDVHYVTDRPHLSDGARVMRLKPRPNADVNQWWMCDVGRYGYKFIDQGRLTKVTHKGREILWGEALSQISEGLKQGSVAVLASAQLTTEELYLIKKLFGESLGMQVTANVQEKPGVADDFLLKADRNPNTAGVQLLGLDSGSAADLVEKGIAGQIGALWVFGQDLVKLFGEEKVKKLSEKLGQFIFIGSNENGTSRHAHWVLPSAVYLEKDGTFVNWQKRVQRIGKAFEPLKGSQPEWEILLDLARRLNISIPAKSQQEIFGQMAAAVPAFAGLTYEKLGWQGAITK